MKVWGRFVQGKVEGRVWQSGSVSMQHCCRGPIGHDKISKAEAISPNLYMTNRMEGKRRHGSVEYDK